MMVETFCDITNITISPILQTNKKVLNTTVSTPKTDIYQTAIRIVIYMQYTKVFEEIYTYNSHNVVVSCHLIQ